MTDSNPAQPPRDAHPAAHAPVHPPVRALDLAAVESHGHGEGESDHHGEREGILSMLRERMIKLEGMPRSLRLITGLTFGQMLAVAVLMVLQLLPQPMLAVSWQNRQTTQMPVVVFVTSVLFLAVAWTFVLSGAIHGHWLLRLPVLGIFTFVLLSEPVPELVVLVRALMLVALWGWAAGIVVARWWRRRKGATGGQVPQRAGPLPLATMLFVALWLVIYDVALLWGADWGQGPGNMLFPACITVQLEQLALFLVPVLFLAGSDLAELGEAVSDRAVHALARLRSPMPLVALSVAVPLAIVGWLVAHDNRSPGAWVAVGLQALVITAVVALLLAVVARWARIGDWPRLHLPLAALALATLLVIAGNIALIGYELAQAGPMGVLGSSDYAVYTSPSGPSSLPFSIAYPKDWLPQPQSPDASGLTAVIFDGVRSQHPGLLLVEAFPLAASSPEQMQQTTIAHLCTKACSTTALAPHDGWQVTGFRTGATVGRLWRRTDGDRGTLIVAEASSAFFDLLAPDFTHMVESYRTDLSATVPPDPSAATLTSDTGITLSIALPAVLALLIGLSLLWRGRRRPGTAAMVGLFAVVFALILLGYLLQRLARLAALPGAPVGFSLPGLQIAVACGTLAAVGWLALRRVLGRRRSPAATSLPRTRQLLALLLAFNVALQIVVAFVSLYDQTLQVTFTALQAVILIVGMTWDLLMSGEQVTNRDDPSFPRHARLLLYFGYSMMVATAVLYFSSQTFVHPAAQSVAPFFEDDQWPQEGLLFLGAPLVVTLFVLNLSRWWRSLPGRRAPEPAPEPVPESARPVVE